LVELDFCYLNWDVPTEMSVLQEAAEQINSLANQTIKESYVRALADSLTFDPNYQPKAESDKSSAAAEESAETAETAATDEDASAEASEASDESNSEETPDDAGETSDSASEEQDDANGEESPPNVLNPKEIAEKYGVTIDDLDAFRIVIRRKPIREFVRTQYGRKVKQSEVTRLLKVESYESFFQKPISRCGAGTKQNATVYSYAEVLQRLGYKEQLVPQQEIIDLFREFNVDFPGV
jgi:DNA mismatch repair ATPase MutL